MSIERLLVGRCQGRKTFCFNISLRGTFTGFDCYHHGNWNETEVPMGKRERGQVERARQTSWVSGAGGHCLVRVGEREMMVMVGDGDYW